MIGNFLSDVLCELRAAKELSFPRTAYKEIPQVLECRVYIGEFDRAVLWFVDPYAIMARVMELETCLGLSRPVAVKCAVRDAVVQAQRGAMETSMHGSPARKHSKRKRA